MQIALCWYFRTTLWLWNPRIAGCSHRRYSTHLMLQIQASRMIFTCSNLYLYVSASMCINMYMCTRSCYIIDFQLLVLWVLFFWEASVIPYIIRFGSSSKLHKNGLEVPRLVTSSLTQILTCWWCCFFLGKSFGCSPLYRELFQDMFNFKNIRSESNYLQRKAANCQSLSSLWSDVDTQNPGEKNVLASDLLSHSVITFWSIDSKEQINMETTVMEKENHLYVSTFGHFSFMFTRKNGDFP